MDIRSKFCNDMAGVGDVLEFVVHGLADLLDARHFVSHGDRESSAQVQEARLQPDCLHLLEGLARRANSDRPVLDVHALRADMESDACEVRNDRQRRQMAMECCTFRFDTMLP